MTDEVPATQLSPDEDSELPPITTKNYHPRLKVYPVGVNCIESYRRHGKLPVIRKPSESCRIFTNVPWGHVVMAWLFTAITSWDLLFINSIFSHESILMLSDSQQEPTQKVKRKLEAFLAFRGMTLASLQPINPIPHWIAFLKDENNQYMFPKARAQTGMVILFRNKHPDKSMTKKN